MYLQELKLNNFKNCQSAELSLSEKINCFVGLNAAGKTNILDAIYYLAFCKSYFTLTDKQNIRHGEDFFAVHGDFHFDNDELHTISCVQKSTSKKSFKCDKKEYERLADHIGKIPLVMISPYDSDLINSGSELRRKFIDGVISQFDASYLSCLLNYNKALQQRNRQLKYFSENRIWDSTLLEMWDQQLIHNAVPINEKRKTFLEEFVPVFQKYYEIVSGTKEQVAITYSSALNEKPYQNLLTESLNHDRYSTYTNVGIHKDDLVFLIDNHQVKQFASQGQQKSFVVAIKLAQFDFNYKKIGHKPILLLDDIFDKLDDNRVSQLVKLVGNDHFGQVFITDTQRQRIKYLMDNTIVNHKIFNVNKGIITSDDE
ncbi:MAG: DNA replication/repair protein RecF [Bacteroidales bacterium]|nr:DNA replication/repair protein RecF [Bacteroidales bacterium]MBR5781250.1 DNA replication/repair protein RecF [Bacteroidales bacterium]